MKKMTRYMGRVEGTMTYKSSSAETASFESVVDSVVLEVLASSQHVAIQKMLGHAEQVIGMKNPKMLYRPKEIK